MKLGVFRLLRSRTQIKSSQELFLLIVTYTLIYVESGEEDLHGKRRADLNSATVFAAEVASRDV